MKGRAKTGRCPRSLFEILVVVAIVAGTTVCFLRPVPAPNNPDFGNVPRVCGVENLQRVRDCVGDTDLLQIDAIDWNASRPGVIKLTTTPRVHLLIRSAAFDDDGTVVGDTCDGFCEKLVDGTWINIGEIEAYLGEHVSNMFTFVSAPCELMPGTDKPDWFEKMRVMLPEYEAGATYRLTYYFHEVDDTWGYRSDELYSVSHTVTIPKSSNRRFDLASAGVVSKWVEEYGGGMQIAPIIQVNYGEVPYVQQHLCTVEKREGSRWVKAMCYNGEPAFVWRHEEDRIYKQMQVRTLKRVSTNMGREYYQVAVSVNISVNDIDALYRVTIPFTEHLDGSGERYTLTLNLRFEE